jgi:peptidyl-prolyl cis-trans isomerase D
MKVVETQYGIHLIQVMNKSKAKDKYKIAYIDRNVFASTETYSNYYTQAAQFVSKVITENNSFDTIVLDENLVKRSDVKVTPEKENIVGLANSRSIVRWMNKASLGDLSEVFEFDNSYVVAKLVKDNNEDYIPLSEVENKVKQNIRTDKKYNKLVERMGKYSSLEALSEKLNVSVINNQEAKLSSLSVDNLGYAPEFIGAIFATDIGGVSSPIKSTNSVSVVSVVSKDDYRSQGDFSLEQESMFEKIKTYSVNASYKALEADANVVDNRSEIY